MRESPRLRASFVLAGLIFLASLALYTWTLMPDLLPADSGEFQVVATTAGVAHPPGYPLYTMVGWLFARLPLGPNPAWRVNLFSAVTAAATVAIVFATARRMTRSAWGGAAAALALAGATTFWATATKASIRPLVGFFTALAVYALIRHRQAQKETDRYLILFALALSLGLTHHASLVFPALAFLGTLLWIDPALIRQPRRWIGPAAALLLGGAVLLYLPLRGGPELRTLDGFLNHVLARGFRGDMFALSLWKRLAILPPLLRFQFNAVQLAAMALSAGVLLWRDRRSALLLLGGAVIHTAVNLTYRAPQTVEYEMPVYVLMALLAAAPFGVIADRDALAVDGTIVCRILAGLAALLLAAILLAGAVNLIAHLPSYRALSRSHDAHDYAETLLREAPTDAVILSNWHWFTPMRYLQQVEGLRPDIEVRYVYPRGRSLAQNWVDEIERAIDRRPVIVVRYFEQTYAELPYRFEPLGPAYRVRRAPRLTLPSEMTRLETILDRQVALRGYRLDGSQAQPGRPLELELAWMPLVSPTTDLALFAQLLGPEGRLWSVAQDRRYGAGELTAGEVVVKRLRLTPLLHAPPGTYTLVVGAYRPGEPGAPRLTTLDGQDAVAVAQVTLSATSLRPVTNHPLAAWFANGPRLIGVDHEAGVEGPLRVYVHWAGPGEAARMALLGPNGQPMAEAPLPALERGEYATRAFDVASVPARLLLRREGEPLRWNLLFHRAVALPVPGSDERYVPFGDSLVLTGFQGPTGELAAGEEIVLAPRFVALRPLERDYIVSAPLVGLTPDGSWAWRTSDDATDSVPAMGAIPTLKWIRGSSVPDPHRLVVPPGAPPGPAVGSLVIYDHFTQMVLLPLDERVGSSVELAAWTVTP